MVTEEQKEELKKLRKKLPGWYAAILSKELRQIGKTYSLSLIRKVANGERTNAYILEKLRLLAAENQRRKKILRRFEKPRKPQS